MRNVLIDPDMIRTLQALENGNVNTALIEVVQAALVVAYRMGRSDAIEEAQPF